MTTLKPMPPEENAELSTATGESTSRHTKLEQQQKEPRKKGIFRSCFK